MAGLKKPTKKRDNSNPNTVIIVFLVFFVILSIGLGTWGYYGYAGQEELRVKAKGDLAVAKAARLAEDYFLVLAQEGRRAVGVQLDADEEARVAADREQFYAGANGKFKDEKTLATFLAFFGDVKKDLTYDDAGKKFVNNYQALLAKYKKDAEGLKTALGAKEAENKAFTAKFQMVQDAYDKLHQDINASIKAGNASALAIATKRYREIEDAHVQVKKLLNQLKEDNDVKTIEIERRDLQIERLGKQITDLNVKLAEASVANPQGGGGGNIDMSPNALLVDASPGRMLWDTALGKIIKIQPDRQVVINLGADDGIKPELTFNVFAAGNRPNRASGPMKGTIEVIRVLDGKTSQARITSLYDYEGYEIPLNVVGRGDGYRESSNVMREGDLILNPLWGSHVAVAGVINLHGASSNSPIDQQRNLMSFLQLLDRQGVVVDAFLDLRDGSIKGKLTAKTRYMIRGDSLFDGQAQPLMKKDDAAEQPAENGAAKQVDEDRIQVVNRGVMALRKEAVERGMFLISPDNFAAVVGYRQPRSATALASSPFRPRAPIAQSFSGSPRPAPAVDPAPAAPMNEIPAPAKDAMEKKDN